MVLGGRGPPKGAEDRTAAAVLRLILGYRIFQRFTDELSNAYETGALMDAYETTGDFALHVGTSPEALPDVTKELLAIAASPIDETRFQEAKAALLGGTELYAVLTGNVAHWLSTRDGRSLGSFLRAVSEVTLEEVEALRRRIFSRLHRILVTVNAGVDAPLSK